MSFHMCTSNLNLLPGAGSFSEEKKKWKKQPAAFLLRLFGRLFLGKVSQLLLIPLRLPAGCYFINTVQT